MKDLSFLNNKIIAHRGFHDLEKGIPENSIEAFKRAIEYNYIIELDVHILKDNSVIVFHDDNYKRMTGYDKKTSTSYYNEIKELFLLNTNSKIPLLQEVLELVDGRVPIIIELKHDTKCGRLEQTVYEILKTYKGKYAIKSFSPFSIYWFKKYHPEIVRGQLTSNYKYDNISSIKRIAMNMMFMNFLTKPDFISCDVRFLPNSRISKLRKSKLIMCWVVKDKNDLMVARDNCDSYICENMDKYLEEDL